MGTKCCWKENKDNSENQTDAKDEKPDVKKKDNAKEKKNANNIKRKSYPLQSKKGKEDLKKEETGVDVLDKRSSTASFHSATSCNDNSQILNPNNSNIISSQYQGYIKI